MWIFLENWIFVKFMKKIIFNVKEPRVRLPVISVRNTCIDHTAVINISLFTSYHNQKNCT